jgi:heme oxygenase-like protein
LQPEARPAEPGPLHELRKVIGMRGTIERGADASDCLERLDGIVAAMADAVTPLLQTMTPERYRGLLSVCYHYTLPSGAQLQRAAELAPTEDLRVFFAAMAEEERDHFRLAEADLAAMGGMVRSGRPAAVDRFANYWNAITRARAFEFLGATYVLENLADRLRERALETVAALGLTRRQSRFVLTHLEADAEHGRAVADLCAHHAADRGRAMIAGAEAARSFWLLGVRELLERY